MGEITIKGFPFSIQIEGDTPTRAEAIKIDQIIRQLGELETLPGVAEISPERQKFLEEQTEAVGLTKEYESTKENIKEINAKRILKELGMYDDTKVPPLEKYLGIDRDKFFIAGSLAGSYPGLEDLFKLKNMKKLASPTQLVMAGGKMFFGGVFGSVGSGMAYDIANYVLSGGDEDFLTTWNQLDEDTRDGIFYESIGLLLPEVIPGMLRLGSRLKEPGFDLVVKSAERLGIDLDTRFIQKYGGMAKALAPIPWIGKTIKKGTEKIATQLNTYYNTIVQRNAPITKFTDVGVNIFDRGIAQFAEGQRILGDLWDKAYKAHAMLPDKNIFLGHNIGKFVDDLVAGKVLRPFAGIPTTKDGIILPWKELVKSGFFEKTNLKRLTKNDAVEDFFQWLHDYQTTIKKQGGELSYDQIRGANDAIAGFFSDLTTGNQYFKNQFRRVLTNLRGANDELLNKENMNIMKVPEKLQKSILEAHEGAMSYTKLLAKLWSGKTGSLFGKFEKGVFEPGLTVEKGYRDQFVKSILNLRSPQLLSDLEKMVGKADTQTVLREFLDTAFQKALKTGDNVSTLAFDPAILAKELGLNVRATGPFWDDVLEKAGIPKSFIEDLARIGGVLEDLPIGNPSDYLRRKVQLSGFKGLMTTFMLGGTGAGTAAGTAVAGSFWAAIPSALVTLMALRYGMGKVFANPKLAYKIMNRFDPGRMEPFKYKLALFKDLFDVHLTEHPEDKEEAINMFSSLINEGKELLTDANIDAIKNITDGWQLEIFKDENLEKIKETIEENENLDERVIDESSMIDVPIPNRDFAMADVVPPLPDPQVQVDSEISGGVDPSIIARMESMGMPLFANEGGIASLMEHKKPQQMVA